MIFIHGFSETSACWNEIIHFLQHDANVVTYDCLGHGNNATLWTDVSFASYVEQLRKIPTYFIHGEYDIMFPNYYSKEMIQVLPAAKYIE